MENMNTPYNPATGAGGKQVYGGTRTAVRRGAEAVASIGAPGEDGMLGLFSPLFVADVPLSAAADTVTLPITVPESLRRNAQAGPRPHATFRALEPPAGVVVPSRPGDAIPETSVRAAPLPRSKRSG